jgi:meso-butanediol dehydrogenase/(S,S)-butanediol dehydrogenase/diacetyl reductase
MKRFEDKTILVAGAGSGIGAACVRRFFAEGASIVAVDVRKEMSIRWCPNHAA